MKMSMFRCKLGFIIHGKSDLHNKEHTLAVLSSSIAKEARFTEFAIVSLRVIQTPEALSSRSITTSRHVRVNVVVTEACVACSTGHKWVTEVVYITLVATDTCTQRTYID